MKIAIVFFPSSETENSTRVFSVPGEQGTSSLPSGYSVLPQPSPHSGAGKLSANYRSLCCQIRKYMHTYTGIHTLMCTYAYTYRCSPTLLQFPCRQVFTLSPLGKMSSSFCLHSQKRCIFKAGQYTAIKLSGFKSLWGQISGKFSMKRWGKIVVCSQQLRV